MGLRSEPHELQMSLGSDQNELQANFSAVSAVSLFCGSSLSSSDMLASGFFRTVAFCFFLNPSILSKEGTFTEGEHSVTSPGVVDGISKASRQSCVSCRREAEGPEVDLEFCR